MVTHFPPKGAEVYVTMKSGAVYRGIFQRILIGGKLELSDVKCCDRKTKAWLICPKHGMNRKLWISKIVSILDNGTQITYTINKD